MSVAPDTHSYLYSAYLLRVKVELVEAVNHTAGVALDPEAVKLLS